MGLHCRELPVGFRPFADVPTTVRLNSFGVYDAAGQQERHVAKIARGRLFGLHGMDSMTVHELDAFADLYLERVDDPTNSDDPKWLKRRATRLRKLARQKEKAVEHKLSQA